LQRFWAEGSGSARFKGPTSVQGGWAVSAEKGRGYDEYPPLRGGRWQQIGRS